MNAANLITLMRLLLVPAIVWLILEGLHGLALWVFALAAISDGVDGYIAKHCDQRTRLGSFLDPIADKAMLVSIYVTLGSQEHLPSWLVILVVSRDVLIVGGVVLSYALGYALKMEPLMISKANTVAQIALAVLVLVMLGLEIMQPHVIEIAVVIVAATTVLSGASYLVGWVRHMALWERPPEDRIG